MLKAGNIIYFDPFFFKNGNQAKPKYFLVVSVDESDSLIASLPSSQDYVPTYVEQNTGCCEIPQANFNCFIIKPEDEVTVCGKTFSLPTYLYGHLLDLYSKDNLVKQYPNEGVDYFVWGTMKSDLFTLVTDCFMNSDSVKNKYKKLIAKSF